ncbi:MDIS1-interacting receptor like kinase 2-like [Vigna umbellata]|uniref:MDIS1-interacting receptor like kinase 2-like n=1 Tax=Vigna umbellata TaxID=87088 RepID=UPI001F5F1AE8|nr:MDIS1-interacting receptor like kinase 2-like [Vigna umbellata]
MVFVFPTLLSMKLKPLLMLLVILFCAFSHYDAASSSDSEANALLKWKGSLDSHSQSSLSSWNGTNPCIWRGIECDDSHSVSHLNLTRVGLKGTLQTFNFSLFPNILVLNMSFNFLSGSIPPLIEQLSNLNTLDLSKNNLSGSIPKTICNLSKLKYLNLGVNGLSGSIPNEVGHLQSLITFDIYNNNLSGSIPPTLGTLPLLELIHLYRSFEDSSRETYPPCGHM